MYRHHRLSELIIGAAIEVHRQLGPGLLESTYGRCLGCELRLRGVPFREQVAIPVRHKGIVIECSYVLDFVVADTVIIEVKSVAQLVAVHQAQLMTYLKLTSYEIGLLVNFNVAALHRGGLRRVYKPTPSS
ncbi:MAG: GxxExxY protein [Sandaracinaceae bacterium]|nr:GxxExxY protein [Sandaracinaceae bacterium]